MSVTLSLDNAVRQCAEYMRGVDGVKAAPDYPPEGMNDYPFVVTYASAGVFEFGPTGVKKGMHNLTVEVHVARNNLPANVESLMRFADTIPNRLMERLLNDNGWDGTISAFQRIRYTFGPLNWNNVATVGFRFTVEDVKIQDTIA